MILHIETPKDCIRKLLELISEFSKVAGWKITTQKHLHFCMLTMKIQKEKLRNQSYSPLQQKKKKKKNQYLGINLPKETKKLHRKLEDTNERNQR